MQSVIVYCIQLLLKLIHIHHDLCFLCFDRLTAFYALQRLVCRSVNGFLDGGRLWLVGVSISPRDICASLLLASVNAVDLDCGWLENWWLVGRLGSVHEWLESSAWAGCTYAALGNFINAWAWCPACIAKVASMSCLSWRNLCGLRESFKRCLKIDLLLYEHQVNC